MKPVNKPLNTNFSSGPTAKRPNWSLNNIKNASLGRSHRSSECKSKLNEIILKSKEILNLPEDYIVGIMPGSDTGSIESALWNLIGFVGVDILAWENFGNDWVIDIVDELKISNINVHKADYGKIPDLSKVDFNNDVIFTWNGTTSGIKVPNGDWIPSDRKGLTICDATSAIFAMEIDYKKCDVLTWSWQKVLGGEGAHGMIALSPRAINRLIKYKPTWPIPKIFRMTKNMKLIEGIFEGSTINTPSMLCVEDALDGLNWVISIGGLKELIKRSSTSYNHINNWINKTNWVEFLSSDELTRSNTSVTFKICEEWFLNLDLEKQKKIMKDIIKLLSDEKVAYDINGYAKAPPSFRVWAGGTIEPNDILKLLPWIDWAFKEIKTNYV